MSEHVLIALSLALCSAMVSCSPKALAGHFVDIS